MRRGPFLTEPDLTVDAALMPNAADRMNAVPITISNARPGHSIGSPRGGRTAVSARFSPKGRLAGGNRDDRTRAAREAALRLRRNRESAALPLA